MSYFFKCFITLFHEKLITIYLGATNNGGDIAPPPPIYPRTPTAVAPPPPVRNPKQVLTPVLFVLLGSLKKDERSSSLLWFEIDFFYSKSDRNMVFIIVKCKMWHRLQINGFFQTPAIVNGAGDSVRIPPKVPPKPAVSWAKIGLWTFMSPFL